VLHCGGGNGPDNVDWVDAITEWVENGTAPDRVIAKKVAQGGETTRTRPICRYPQHAEYKGSGGTDEADNFVCK
jgi:feruloyl esterase